MKAVILDGTQEYDNTGKPLVPHWVYRLMAAYSWLQQAKHYQALTLLWRRPYLTRAQ